MIKKYFSFLVVLFGLSVTTTSFAQPSTVASNDFGYIADGTTTAVVVANVLSNDHLNGSTATTSNVSLNQISTGNPLVQLAADGSVSITAGIPIGTYTLVYQICNLLYPSDCGSAAVTISVGGCPVYPPVIDNIFAPVCGSSVGSVALSGLPVSGWNLNITLNGTPIPVISGSGATTVINNLTTGMYSITVYGTAANCTSIAVNRYLNFSPNGCLQTSLVETYVDYNLNGYTDVGDIITYQTTLINQSGGALTNITVIGNGALAITGGPLATLAAGATDNTTFSGIYVLTQNNINAGTVSNMVQVNFNAPASYSTSFFSSFFLNISDGIKVNAFIDSNGNGLKEVSEPYYTGGTFKYEINNDGVLHNAYTSVTIYESNPSTTYDLSYLTNSPYISCAVSYPNVTVAAGSGITTYDFPLTALPYNDTEILGFNMGTPPRPGFLYTVNILYSNRGSLAVASGTITFTKDNAVTVYSTSVASTATATGFTYNFTNLLPYETRNIVVQMQVPTIPTVALGQHLTSSVSISMPAGDVNVINNNQSCTQFIVGSYDPNDIVENHGEKILYSSFTSNDYLTYVIRFENTGTANAINIRVNDVLDAKLDETSIRPVSASHNYSLDRVNNNLTWKFDGIDLPPSVADTNTGKGFIVFQVKPKPGYAVGDIIPNAADIYFDFNPAIVTNTFNTEFVAMMAVNQFEDGSFAVYPNPTKDVLNISMKDSWLIDTIIVNDVLGNSVIVKNVKDSNAIVDMSQLSNGFYFVKVKANGSEKIVKVIKE